MKLSAETQAKVDAVLRQTAVKETAAPPIQSLTEREMAAGAKQSARWAEQQKNRPQPSAKDIKAAGSREAAISVSLKPQQ